MTNFPSEIEQTIMPQNVVLAYRGNFTQEVTKIVLATADSNLEATEEPAYIRRRVFHVAMELLQNLVRHRDESATRGGYGIFLLFREPSHYTIMSCNPVRRTEVGALRKKLNQINSLDRQQLKDLYTAIIKDRMRPDKGGAGLGFVDIARKSGEKIWFDFTEIRDNFGFFYLKVIVPRA